MTRKNDAIDPIFVWRTTDDCKALFY